VFGQKATAQQLKEHNQRLVLRAIYTGRATSRAAIAEETDLTRPTVSQIVGELLEAELVREEGQGESRGGKPPTLLSFVDDAYQIIGLHLEGRRTFGALTDLRGQILAHAARPTDDMGAEDVLLGLGLVLDELRVQATRPLLGIGVSVPGLVDPVNGVVRYTAYLNWRDVPLGERLAAHCGDDIPIYVDNDTNLAALGERVFGAGDGTDNMVIVMVGTVGTGAGIVLNGEILHGVSGAAGEIGHMPVADSDVPCVCGRRGCLEAAASGWALVRRAREAAAAHPESALNALGSDGVTFEGVRRAVEAGDPTAVALAQEVGHYLGLVVAILASTVNPRRVVIGGSLSELGDPLFESLRCTFSEHALAILAQETEILPASLGSDVNTLGAVAQVLKGELGVV
jgi:glucokinase-like ROK family protein